MIHGVMLAFCFFPLKYSLSTAGSCQIFLSLFLSCFFYWLGWAGEEGRVGKILTNYHLADNFVNAIFRLFLFLAIIIS